MGIQQLFWPALGCLITKLLRLVCIQQWVQKVFMLHLSPLNLSQPDNGRTHGRHKTSSLYKIQKGKEPGSWLLCFLGPCSSHQPADPRWRWMPGWKSIYLHLALLIWNNFCHKVPWDVRLNETCCKKAQIAFTTVLIIAVPGDATHINRDQHVITPCI